MATSLLLADDSPTIAKILKMALQSEPYEIRAVLTAEEALKELRSAPPYFFLCDLTLPEKNGYEFAKLIKRDSKLKQVRVVLLASAFEPVDEAEYQASGADGLVKKPFDPSELRQTLRTIAAAPSSFPSGTAITGSLSGFMVNDGENTGFTNVGVSQGGGATTDDTLANLLAGHEAPPSGADADSILAGLVEGGLVEPPRESTVALDFAAAHSAPPAPSSEEGVLDISGEFATESGNTAMIDFSGLEAETPPAAPPKAAPAPSIAPVPAKPVQKADAPLSPNAQALAAFFDAEIKSQDEPPPPPAAASPKKQEMPEMPVADPFDASLSSIEWNAGAADASLSGWSSNQPSKSLAAAAVPANEKPPPFSKPSHSAKTTTGFTAVPPSAGATNANAMFDTGGASFRFSNDYIDRITKAFTGAPDEVAPTHHATAPVFPQQSDDRPAAKPAPAGGPGGGAWSEQDVAKIEKIVREEVQMVVREVAEKIAWEVIPELAENLIRKELDKVLKEMGQ